MKAVSVEVPKIETPYLCRFQIRLGTTYLNERKFIEGYDVRRIVDITWHNKYKPGEVYYDVGIAVTSKRIEFNEYIRPVCLPYLPIDNDNHFESENVISVGWQQALNEKTDTVELKPKLKLQDIKVSCITI